MLSRRSCQHSKPGGMEQLARRKPILFFLLKSLGTCSASGPDGRYPSMDAAPSQAPRHQCHGQSWALEDPSPSSLPSRCSTTPDHLLKTPELPELSLPAVPVPFSHTQPSTGKQQGHFWPRVVQFEQSKIEPTSERCQAKTGLYLLRSPSPSPAVSHRVFAFLHHKTLALKICFALVPVSKQAAQVPLPSFPQARGCETTELWAKRLELSQKSLHPGAAQNEFSNNFVSFSLSLHFSPSLYLTQPPCTEVPCLEAFRASRNPAARRSEDIIRAARLSALSPLPCRFTPQSLALHRTKPGCLRPLRHEGDTAPSLRGLEPSPGLNIPRPATAGLGMGESPQGLGRILQPVLGSRS